jgi:large subunit ribosomal protein L7/L12
MPEKKKETKYSDLISKIEKMTTIELNELVQELEDKFGPVVMASGGAGGGEAEAAAEEKSEYDIELTASGSSVIATIKVVKEVTELGLVDAKKLVDSAPTIIREKVKKEEAEEIKKKLEEAGASVDLK